MKVGPDNRNLELMEYTFLKHNTPLPQDIFLYAIVDTFRYTS